MDSIRNNKFKLFFWNLSTKSQLNAKQIHETFLKIILTLENKKYCSAAFWDIANTFDKVCLAYCV